MKPPSCLRTWEAEAIEDGRLDDPAARASFERHATGCDVCANERRSLARIKKAVETLPEYPSQPIDRRRLRMALLQRANERLMRGRSNRVGIWTFAACAVVLVVVGARWGAIRRLHSPAIRVPAFEVVEVGHASWTTTATAGMVHVALSDGTTAVHVEHLGHDQEFLVELPDGDLEVRGTRFQVSVVDKRTRHLEVSEGVVALRLAGQPQVVLTAGQNWSAPASIATASFPSKAVRESPIPSSEVAVAESVPPAHSNQVALLAPPTHAKEIAVVKAASRPIVSAPASVAEGQPTPPVEGSEPVQASDQGARAGRETSVLARDMYTACISAFRAGDYATASSLLAAFAHDHPSDPRSEDAAFLLAVSHARIGDGPGAARLAKEYLRKYPMGLRRKEAERLARTAEASTH
jgi:TolA-binding protein